MAKSVVELGVKDSGFKARIKDAIRTFASLGNAANNAKGQFAKFADGIAKVAQSQELLNAALKGNPYGMMASAATMAFTKIIEMATEASDVERRLAAEAEMKAERQQAANEAIGRSTGELMAKYEMLRVQWKALSSEQEQNEWIANNQSAFKSLNLAVTDVTSAENVFVNNTSKVVAALKARAEAEAYGELYKEQIKKNAMNKATGKYNTPLITDPYYRPTDMEASLAGFTTANKHENFEYKWVENADPRNPGKHREWTGKLSKVGLQRLNDLRSMGKTANEMADEAQANYWANKMTQAQANASALSNNNLFGPIPKGGKSGKSSHVEVPVKPIYVPEEGTPDYIKAMIADMQKQIGMEKDSDKRLGLLMDIESLKDEYKTMTSLPKIGEDMADDFEVALGPLQQLTKELEQLKTDLELAPNTAAYQDGLQKIADKEKEIEQFKGTGLIDNAKQTAQSYQYAASAINTVGAALSNIEDPSAKVFGIVAQAIATVAQAYAGALSSDSTTKGNIWAFIAAAAAATISMAETIASIHQATGYAQGGIVDGNSYSGDNIPIMANAGEIVLSKSMQNTLASNLQGNGLGSLELTATLYGEDLRFALNNNGRRTGRGEYVTTRFR